MTNTKQSGADSGAFSEGRAARILGLPMAKNPYAPHRADARYAEHASNWDSGWIWEAPEHVRRRAFEKIAQSYRNARADRLSSSQETK